MFKEMINRILIEFFPPNSSFDRIFKNAAFFNAEATRHEYFALLLTKEVNEILEKATKTRKIDFEFISSNLEEAKKEWQLANKFYKKSLKLYQKCLKFAQIKWKEVCEYEITILTSEVEHSKLLQKDAKKIFKLFLIYEKIANDKISSSKLRKSLQQLNFK